MRTLFIGGTKRGYLTLTTLLAHGIPVTGIISLRQDEHETERHEQPIRNLANTNNIPLFETRFLQDRDYARLIAHDLRPEVAFVVGCRVLISKSIYSLPPRGTLAVHDSLLPEYRGFAPLNWSILNGENHTGVTLFHLGERMDEGDIVAQKKVPIGPDDTAQQVFERVCQATNDVVLEACALLARGEAPRQTQHDRPGSYTCSRGPADGFIDWTWPTVRIYNLIRALGYPYPGAFTYHNERKLWIWKAHPLAPAPVFKGRIPGRVVATSKLDGSVDVLTGDGQLRLTEVQLRGEAPSAPAQIIRSVRCTLGFRPDALLDRLECLQAKVDQLTESLKKTSACLP